jgi:hypothetical protein
MRTPQIALAAIVLFGAACASYPKPTESLAASEASLRAAQEFGAQRVPPAALQYQLAKEELERAETLMKDNDNEKADQMLSRARADSELAIALTKQAKAQADAQAANQQLNERTSQIHTVQ